MKDKQIQQLFDNYAETLEPQTHLAEKACAECRASSRKKTATRRAVFKPILAACCVFVVLVVFGVSLHSIGIPPLSESPSVVAYNVSSVRGRSVGRTDVEDILPMDVFDNSASYKIVSERYYAFYFKDSNQLAYIKAILGVSTENGIVELSVVAESKDFVRNDLQTYYEAAIKDGNGVQYGTSVTENGEYVTSAFFEAREMHFYISARGNPLTKEDVKEIIEFFA